MRFLHDGIPMPTRKAVVVEAVGTRSTAIASAATTGTTCTDRYETRLLGSCSPIPTSPASTGSSANTITRCRAASVIKPLIGPLQIGPSDAAVIRPKLDSYTRHRHRLRLAPHIEDPYEMAIAAIDEAIRNVVAVGADPTKHRDPRQFLLAQRR